MELIPSKINQASRLVWKHSGYKPHYACHKYSIRKFLACFIHKIFYFYIITVLDARVRELRYLLSLKEKELEQQLKRIREIDQEIRQLFQLLEESGFKTALAG